MKKIPIGVDDFKKIITDNYFYIDKTKFIEEILNDGAEVKLFTRPRRFGKTLNMSMLKYFFDVRDAEENRKLFKGLEIEKSSYFKEQGKYPVIFISMKDIKGNTWEKLFKNLKIKISHLFSEYRFLLKEVDKIDSDFLEKIIFNETKVILFFPGEYTTTDLRLFGFKDNNYYRAFKI